MENILEARGLTKNYGATEVLHGVGILRLSRTKFTWLNRAQRRRKTTMLSLLTVQRLTSGTVTYGGEPVWENQHRTRSHLPARSH